MGGATIKSPSGANGCDFGGDRLICVTTAKTFPPPDPTVTAGFLGVDLSKASPELMGYGTAPDTVSGDTLPYGSSVYVDNYVIHSSEAGLTAWNTTTGHGALINKSGIYRF